MKKLIFVLTITVFCISGCLSGSGSYRYSYDFGDIEKIAIVAVEGELDSEAAKDQVADLFAMELLDKGYAPIRLAQVRVRAEALTKSKTIPDLPQDAYAEVGQIFKVPAVLVINVPFFQEQIFITAHLIDVKDGSVLWMDKDSEKISQQDRGMFAYGGNSKKQEDYLMDPFLIFQEPPEANQEMPEKPRTLTPLELEIIENIVSEICSSLPSVTNKEVTRTKTRTSTSDW